MHHSRSEFLTGASALLAAASGKKPAPTPTLGIPTLEASADPPGVPRGRSGGRDGAAGCRQRPIRERPPQARQPVAGAAQSGGAAPVPVGGGDRLRRLARAARDRFDQGLGDLFVCRVAGNVADTAVTGSIEYAAEHFHPALIVVLGTSAAARSARRSTRCAAGCCRRRASAAGPADHPERARRGGGPGSVGAGHRGPRRGRGGRAAAQPGARAADQGVAATDRFRDVRAGIGARAFAAG